MLSFCWKGKNIHSTTLSNYEWSIFSIIPDAFHFAYIVIALRWWSNYLGNALNNYLLNRKYANCNSMPTKVIWMH